MSQISFSSLANFTTRSIWFYVLTFKFDRRCCPCVECTFNQPRSRFWINNLWVFSKQLRFPLNDCATLAVLVQFLDKTAFSQCHWEGRGQKPHFHISTLQNQHFQMLNEWKFWDSVMEMNWNEQKNDMFARFNYLFSITTGGGRRPLWSESEWKEFVFESRWKE